LQIHGASSGHRVSRRRGCALRIDPQIGLGLSSLPHMFRMLLNQLV